MTKEKRDFYDRVFRDLMIIGMDQKFPKNLCKKLDEIADYIGDIASGRKSI